MMGPGSRRIDVALVVAVLLWSVSAGSARAEVGCVHVSAGDPEGYIFAIQEDPNPVPSAWIPIATGGSGVRVVLNAEGAARGDGEPRMIDHPTTGEPIVVWARNAGSNYDVVLSRFTDGAWTEPAILAGSPDSELDPAVAIDPADGSVHVVYWVLGAPPVSSARVVHIQAPMDLSVWSPPVEISSPGELAARPAAVFHDGALHAVYESTLGDGPPYYVVLATRTGGSWSTGVVLGVSSFGPLWPEIHAQGSALWTEWIDAADSMAWVVWESGSGWSAPNDESYTTLEDRDFFARGRIRSQALD